ncbi:hypothetical protein MMC16_007402 [Acarospora aff. strigata]|nr:hypothetical protein [Acarospora aff. strigata]
MDTSTANELEAEISHLTNSEKFTYLSDVLQRNFDSLELHECRIVAAYQLISEHQLWKTKHRTIKEWEATISTNDINGIQTRAKSTESRIQSARSTISRTWGCTPEDISPNISKSFLQALARLAKLCPSLPNAKEKMESVRKRRFEAEPDERGRGVPKGAELTTRDLHEAADEMMQPRRNDSITAAQQPANRRSKVATRNTSVIPSPATPIQAFRNDTSEIGMLNSQSPSRPDEFNFSEDTGSLQLTVYNNAHSDNNHVQQAAGQYINPMEHLRAFLEGATEIIEGCKTRATELDASINAASKKKASSLETLESAKNAVHQTLEECTEHRYRLTAITTQLQELQPLHEAVRNTSIYATTGVLDAVIWHHVQSLLERMGAMSNEKRGIAADLADSESRLQRHEELMSNKQAEVKTAELKIEQLERQKTDLAAVQSRWERALMTVEGGANELEGFEMG